MTAYNGSLMRKGVSFCYLERNFIFSKNTLLFFLVEIVYSFGENKFIKVLNNDIKVKQIWRQDFNQSVFHTQPLMMSMTIASSDQVANLQAMFPDVPEYVIVSLLKQNGCSMEATAEALIRAQEIASIVVPSWWDSFWQTHRSTIGYSESQAKQLVFKVWRWPP